MPTDDGPTDAALIYLGQACKDFFVHIGDVWLDVSVIPSWRQETLQQSIKDEPRRQLYPLSLRRLARGNDIPCNDLPPNRTQALRLLAQVTADLPNRSDASRC